MSKKDLYRARDIKKILGVSKNRLFYLQKTHKLIKPSIKAEGTGHMDYYCVSDLMRLAQIELLSMMGFKIKNIKFILRRYDSRIKQRLLSN